MRLLCSARVDACGTTDPLTRFSASTNPDCLAEGVRDLDLFIERAGIELIEVSVAEGRAARRTYSRYGKGHHAAGLNFGDCFAYALATERGEPLLFKGTDFSKTDVFR